MKRFIAVLSGLLVLPAFAEVAPVYYEDVVEYTDDMIDAVDETEDVAQPKQVATRKTVGRSTSRAVASGSGTASRATGTSRAVASSPRTAQTTSRGTISRAARTPSVTSRAKSTSTRSATVTSRNSANKPVTARASVRGSVMAGTRASGLKASTVSSINGASSSFRASTVRASTSSVSTGTPILTEESVSSTTSNLNAIAELTDYCKTQYMACMDNYCNVLDDDQGRCSCSKNIETYATIEDKLKEQVEAFQDTVQKIKYIGLTTDQINTLFTQTQAEVAMSNNKSDTTQLAKDLNAIRTALKDVSSPKATSNYESDSLGGLNLNFDFDFDSTGSDMLGDLGSLFGGSSSKNTTSISNRRGKQLYDTAVKRCKTAVLDSCTAQGIDANVISNAYDLEIDKQCYAYERSLNDEIKDTKSKARNAATILQQARLMLAQNKNSYDLRGCVAAIDACMQDEYVCGSDYELCLDPTGKYIANGSVVVGGTPGVSGGQVANTDSRELDDDVLVEWKSKGMYELYSAWNYNSSANPKVGMQPGADVMNPWSDGSEEHLANYINAAVTTWAGDVESTSATTDMAVYVLRKMGYIDTKTNVVHGMCASIFKQCQDYTYDKKDKFKPDNDVVRQFLANALTKIKLKQDAVLSNYAEDCRSDVSSCLSTNGYDGEKANSTISTTAVNACRAEIVTCMSVGGYKPATALTLTLRDMRDWVDSMLKSCGTNQYLTDDTTLLTNTATTTKAVKCQSCPRVPGYNAEGEPDDGITVQLVSNGGQVSLCSCPDEYPVVLTTCTGEEEEGVCNTQTLPAGMPSACRKEQ